MATESAAEDRTAAAIARTLASELRATAALPEGVRLLDWDADHGLSFAFEGRRGALLVELSERDEGIDCLARTARFNLAARDPFDQDRTLDVVDDAVVRAVVRGLSHAERRLPMVPRPSAPDARCDVREVTVARALVREGRGQYYLNPYVGCTIGCRYCFVERQADLSRALEGLPARPWGRWVDVKSNLPEVLRDDVQHLEPGIVRMSPIVTDPYQPLERRHRITRRCLEVLLDAGFSPCLLTRAVRIVEDVPLLARFERAWVGFSIPTDDDDVRRAFEPGADGIDARLHALQRCRAAGLPTFAVVQPMLPMTPERLIERLAPLIDVVRIDRLHLSERVRGIYQSIGALHALSPEWISATEAALRDGFSRRGVRLHPLEDLGDLFAAGAQGRAGGSAPGTSML